MALQEVIKLVDDRLDQGAGGADGWFAITRVHLDPASLHDCIRYLADRGADTGFIGLSSKDYKVLGKLVGNDAGDPKVGLNRHQLLALYQPLGFLERENENRVSPTRLSAAGIELANATKPETIFDQQLAKITFCRKPYYTADREAKYKAFNVRIYPATLSVMAGVDGWINRDEFDLFVSRIRTMSETAWAVDGIKKFRGLPEAQKSAVLSRVQAHGNLSKKVYQNWRDMGPHTFSLFALGASAVRVGNVLSLASVSAKPEPKQAAAKSTSPKTGAIVGTAATAATKVEKNKVLRIPEPAATESIGVEPPPPAANDGRGAEIFVGKLMAATGWRVVYYSHRRGYGFDIWAAKGSAVLYVEVKSCTSGASTLSFTPNEMLAAKQYGDNFLLVVVENFASPKQSCWSIQNPAATLAITVSKIESHKIPATQWRKAAKSMES